MKQKQSHALQASIVFFQEKNFELRVEKKDALEILTKRKSYVTAASLESDFFSRMKR